MAGGVERDGVRKRGADVGDAQLVDEELGELEHARQKRVDACDERRIPRGGRHLGIVLADHRDARRGRHADHLRAVEDPEEMFHQPARLAGVPGVVMHLPAAGLLAPEFDAMAKALEHGDHGFACFREQRVVVAGDEQRNQHYMERRDRGDRREDTLEYFSACSADSAFEDRVFLTVLEEAYRRNASGSPPSTGMTWPVVFALASPASQQIAFAQSTGRIGRRVIVRLA